jgi:hypothetical protein
LNSANDTWEVRCAPQRGGRADWMRSGFIYIAYAADDASDVAALADGIRDTGWSVCFGHLAEPGADDFSLAAERLGEAVGVIVVWSASAGNSSSVRSDAIEAARRNKLILVVLDDATPPGPWPVAARHNGRLDLFASEVVSAVLTHTRGHGDLSGKGRGSIVPYSFARQSSQWLLPMAVAIALSIGGVAGYLIKSSFSTASTQTEVTLHSKAAGARAADAIEDKGAEAWDRVLKNNPSAIRRFLMDFGQTQAAADARRLVLVLEESAWRQLLEMDDMTEQLDALVGFRVEYPEGAYSLKAASLEKQRRKKLDTARTNLILLGLVPPGSGNDMDQVRRGIENFEHANGLPASGRLTDKMASSISSSAEFGMMKPGGRTNSPSRRN